MAETNIEWCDVVWNPTVGCSRVSPGCDNCYAMHFAHRGMSSDWSGLTKLRPKGASRPGVDWTGVVRTMPGRLAIPLHWRKPRRIFVDSMSDLFHERVPFEFIAAVFGIMAACPQHTFQLLTKRPHRAREFFDWAKVKGDGYDLMRIEPSELLACAWEAICGDGMDDLEDSVRDEWVSPTADVFGDLWPLPNVWLGVSVEDQATADARVPELLECPAALRFVSYEPALGPVRFDGPMRGWLCCGVEDLGGPHIDWIIVGGESGRGARPFDLAWPRAVIAQARGTGCAVFVKQLGARPFYRNADYKNDPHDHGYIRDVMLADRKGGDMAEWPKDLRVREMPRTKR